MNILSLCTFLISATTATAVSPQTTPTNLPSAITDADFPAPASAEKIELGRLLFFDKLLSGNRNIACSTCHHPSHASGDGLALPLGEGPTGLGPDRHSDNSIGQSVQSRVPRNSPALFNLGATEFTQLFHDGRVATDPEHNYAAGFITPARWKLPTGLDSVLAAQAMFPVTSDSEMAGHRGENPIADAAALRNAAGPNGIWKQLAQRLRDNPQYVTLFKQAYPQQVNQPQDISFVLAANAIAAFEQDAFRSDHSPFDSWLQGDQSKLSASAERGMVLFYGDARCSSCHSGKFQTDQQFHAIAMPQIGPGKGDGRDPGYWQASGLRAFPEDYGRGRVTARVEDRYRFRTPSLRNVALTGPWGHAGSYASLEAVVRHHLQPLQSLHRYQPNKQTLLALGDNISETTALGSSITQQRLSPQRQQDYQKRDDWVQQNPDLRQRIADANQLPSQQLSDDQINDLLTFLHSLTDPSAKQLQRLVPETVPSGLAVSD